ncbi:MAG TPA: metallophosphoesterase [Kofleriaceae bacterium]|nr:metallophosphoesterase [Kofleriaceae bacterium]
MRCRRLVHAVAALLAVGCGVPPGLERGDWEEPEPSIFQTGPYIVLGRPGTAYVALRADGIPAPVVEWWVASAVESTGPMAGAQPVVRKVLSVREQDLWVARLDDLPIGPKVSYRVHSAAGDSAEHAFHAGAAGATHFRFAVFGDTRTGHSVHRQLMEALDKEDIDFLVHTGDMVERGGRKEEWMRFFQIEREVLADMPIVPAIGNHDVSARRYFERYFLQDRWSDDRHFYTFDWGNLRIVVLDSGIECRSGCEQFAFAERALREGARRGQLMAMMLHYPAYSSGRHGPSLNVQKPVSDLARRYGVELVITGHDHHYERTKPIEGTTYIVSGSAGAPVRPVSPRWFTAEARTEPHYILIDVDEKRLIMRAVNLQGDTFDTHVMEDLPPAK